MMNFKAISWILAISVVIAILLVGCFTSILRERPTYIVNGTKEKIYPLSFSRTQLWLWSLVIIPCFILYWGHIPGNVPSLNLTGLALLGISIGTGFTSWTINEVKRDSKSRPTFKKNLESSKKWLTDLLMDDSGDFSVTRLQQFLFTVVYIIIYVLTFFSSKMVVYPKFDEYALYLMGISAGGYLLGKGVYK